MARLLNQTFIILLDYVFVSIKVNLFLIHDFSHYTLQASSYPAKSSASSYFLFKKSKVHVSKPKIKSSFNKREFEAWLAI